MTEAKHTPKEWLDSLFNLAKVGRELTKNPDAKLAQSVILQEAEKLRAQWTAAPDLLEALIDLGYAYNGKGDPGEAWNKADAAIAKAEPK